MRISVNDTTLYFDVEGAGLVPDGKVMREKPTLILLHGGPGADHSIYKPSFSPLAELVQIIYLDHRGNGRSDQSDESHWNLNQWADDLDAFCDALDIKKPIVYGASFGGFVAQAYATRHPDRIGKLVLCSTAAKFDFQELIAAFDRLGGKAARDAAEGYWLNPTSESRAEYRKICVPLYQVREGRDPHLFDRVLIKDDVALWFNGPDNEMGRMDFRDALGNVTCPVLIMAGEKDPVTPPVFSEVIRDSLTAAPTRLELFQNCGHGIIGDDPAAFLQCLSEFILTVQK